MDDLLARLHAALADRYTIERELGQGGMATVYLAQDLKHHRPVAIKVLKPELAAALGPERFLREIETAARLTHPHILPLHDSGEAGGFLYYVMPFVEGNSLRGRLDREKQLPLTDALQITREVADALSYAHRHDVVHRDIKPENILFQAEHAVVADFGIARAITAAGGDQLTTTGMAVGTPAYMSPEQAADDPHLDGRTDIFSLGCVLYEMLAGEPPFRGPTAQAINARRLKDPVPSLRSVRETVPELVESGIGKALAKVPADRFATAEQFAEALGMPTPGAITAERPLRPGWGPVGRRVAYGAGLAVVVLLATYGVFARLHARRDTEGSAARAPNSIAVLFFDNLTHDSAYAYLADGLTEELISRLGLVQRLDVKSRFESLRVRDRRGAGAAELGQALHAAYLLSGSVQPGAGRMRVTAELVRAASGARVWGGLLDGAGGDLLAAQESIATAVVQKVVGQLLPQERTILGRRATRDSAAYDLYLRGRVLQSRFRGEPDQRAAMALYQRALARDSTFALAWAGIAYAWGWLVDNGGVPPLEALPRAREAAERALALDSSTALAYLALATPVEELDFDFARAEALTWRAVALDPRLADAHVLLSQLLVIRGRPAEALAEVQRAWELDSTSGVVIGLRTGTLRFVGRAGEALALARAPNYPFPEDKPFSLLDLQRCEEARSVLRRWPREGYSWYFLGLAAACVGQRDEAHAALDSLAAFARRGYVPPTLFAEIHAALGEADETFRWLDRAYDRRDDGLLIVNREWSYKPVQADPRWAALMRRIGLPWPAPVLPP